MAANTAADFGTSAIGAFARAAGLAALVLGGVLALVFAFAAALVVALMIAGAALVLRFWPQRRSEPEVLEARRTPAGWVVESSSRRS